MSSRWSSWPACAGMTSVGSARCSRCPPGRNRAGRVTRRAGTTPDAPPASSEACLIPLFLGTRVVRTLPVPFAFST